MPRARSHSSRPVRTPVIRWRVARGAAAIRPTESSPYPHRVRAVAAPTPSRAAAGSGARKAASSPRPTTKVVPGATRRAAIRATMGLAPAPIAQSTPCRASARTRITEARSPTSRPK
ncbi:hypothetical protein SMICM304S_08842 [Streptomyces microflavus]